MLNDKNLFKILSMGMSSKLADSFTKLYEKALLDNINRNYVPRHIGIIMDGNRRYAQQLGMDPKLGHYYGKEKLYEVLEWCMELGIKIVTVYAFSTENFMRGKDEVISLMNLFEESIEKELKEGRIHKNRIKVKIIGRRELLPKNLIEKIERIEEETKNYNDYILNIAIAYGGREEIIDAIKKIAQDVLENKLSINDINEETVRKNLYTADLPDPDLILRTSGEERISNFLLWQSAYSELYFTDVYWPSFSKIDFLKAILSYQRRERRFGR